MAERPTAARLADVRRIAAGLDRPFVGGEFRGFGGPRLAATDPYAGETLAEVEAATAEVVDAAVAAARAAARGPWSALAPEERGDLLVRLAGAIVDRHDELAVLESLDVGKPITHALADDVPTAARVLRWYGALAATAYDRAPRTGRGARGLALREPQGVVGLVLPWNYPLTTLALKLGPALAAGNAVVAKPSELTPLSALWLAALMTEVGFPAGVVNVVPGTGAEAGRAIGLHRDIDAVNFTGSTRTGRLFLHYAAESNLKEVSLECGGKNPAIVLPDVGDLDAVVRTIATGFMMNSGQLCSSISRLLVPAERKDEIIAALEREMALWPIGDPFDPSTRIGPLVGADHARKVAGYVEAERARGGRHTASRAPRTGDGPNLVAPIVFHDVAADAPVWRDEIFGPVLAVRTYASEDEAVASANASEYGLSAYLFSNDAAAIDRVSRGLDAGLVAVNAFCEGDLATPFGGFKRSGFGGKDKGIHALDQYSRVKGIWWEAAA
jgi:gamma-glutamyl-gamma-aminobutyraldehyde dehydrogenase